jgi:hypothetical protein
MMDGIPQAGGHGLVQRQGHDEKQAVEAVRVSDLGVLHAEAARFEIREHRLKDPS